MKLTQTSDCNLILEGYPSPGLEVLVYNYDDIIVINRDGDEQKDVHIYTMERDGLYQYYLLDIADTATEKDILDYIRKYKEDPEVNCEIFSICKIRNCLIDKEKTAITSFLKGCTTNSHCNTSNKATDDFLLVSIFLLENLICRGNYEEAIRIVNAISTCGICNTKSKTCNCCK
jgi:hypothetical protein